MNFFKKISSKRISTAPDERNKSKFKFKNKPLPPSPPLSKDDSLLELNIPDDFSSFDIPQLQSIHKQSVASIEDDQPTHTVINITTENTTTTAISLLESFSKTEAEQGTRMHAEVDNSTASSTISENHSELALEFTENQTNSCPYSQTQEEGEHETPPLLNESTEDFIGSIKDISIENDLPIENSTTSNVTINLQENESPGNEIKDAPILSIETNQVLFEENKDLLNSADESNSRSLHQSSSMLEETVKPILSRCSSRSDAVLIENETPRQPEQESPVLLSTKSNSSKDDILEITAENKEETVSSLAVASPIEDQEPQTLDSSILSGNDINEPNSTDENQTNRFTTPNAVKRRSVHSLIPRKQLQQIIVEEPIAASKLPVQISKTRLGACSGIPLPSRLVTTVPPVIIQETLTTISSPSSSSGSLGKSTRPMSSASTISTSSNNSHHSQHQQQRKGTGGRSPVHNYRPLIQPQSKIPIAAGHPSAEMTTKPAETTSSNSYISRLPKRNSTIM